MCIIYIYNKKGHRFHAICLTKWMNVKLNCPTCRSVLPPLI